jgi:hypothetical protein
LISRVSDRNLFAMVGLILDLAATFLIAGNSFSSVDHCCQGNGTQSHSICSAAAGLYGPRDGIYFALTSIRPLEAEVEYANRKSVLLFRAPNSVDGDSECPADEIGASARSPFARLRFAGRRVTPAGQVLQ